MSTMKSVWITESGEYSDYHLCGIFGTEEEAKAYAEKSGSECREWKLNTWAPGISTWLFSFRMDTGDIQYVKEKAPEFTSDSGPSPKGVDFNVGPYGSSIDGKLVTSTHIEVTLTRGGEGLARKIACEKFIKMRAHLDEAEALCKRAGIVSSATPFYVAYALAGERVPEQVVKDVLALRETASV